MRGTIVARWTFSLVDAMLRGSKFTIATRAENITNRGSGKRRDKHPDDCDYEERYQKHTSANGSFIDFRSDAFRRSVICSS